MKHLLEAYSLLFISASYLLVVGCSGDTCPGSTNPICSTNSSARNDCYPEPGSAENPCYARDCNWCPINDGKEGPWCFYYPTSICNTIDKSPRMACGDPGATQQQCISQNCHYCPTKKEGAPWCCQDPRSVCFNYTTAEKCDCMKNQPTNRTHCLSHMCHWCPSDNSGVPWCFYDKRINCSAPCTNITDDKKIDCHPDTDAAKQRCINRMCSWCNSSKPNVPWCYYNSTGWDYTPPIFQGENFRIDGHPEPNATKERCQTRGGIWQESNTPNVPWCHLPPTYGYEVISGPIKLPKGYQVTLRRYPFPPPYAGRCPESVSVKITFNTPTQLNIKITENGTNSSFLDPVEILLNELLDVDDASCLYEVKFYKNPAFCFKVTRKSTKTDIFNTCIGGFVFCDQFIQIATLLPSRNLYGFGQNDHPSLRHDLNWKTWSMWTRDHPPDGTMGNLYGVHPYYTVLENDGNCHGVLFFNSHAQEVKTMPAPALTYRAIGGNLNMYYFLGPTPSKTCQQYSKLLGRSYMPPYWALGYQQSKYGYGNLTTMVATIDRTRNNGIPQDVQYGDIDVMNRNLDFTYDTDRYKGLPQYFCQKRKEGLMFVPIVDPGITTGEAPGTYKPFDLGCELDVWIKRRDGTPALGQVWPDAPVVYPDFTHPKATMYWTTLLTDYSKLLCYDGIWIDMNDPSNFKDGDFARGGCGMNRLNYPPYTPAVRDGRLFAKTLCMDNVQHAGYHYSLHNLYGLQECITTHKALLAVRENKRPFVLTRSSFPSSGRYGASWLGDNKSTWDDMRRSMIGIMEFNLFGIPLTGADVCGYSKGTGGAKLCQRWMQLGAFYPFCRNHNSIDSPPQDPAALGKEVAISSRKVLLIRYFLLPYLYTLFFKHCTEGTTVVRPLWHEYPTDNKTWGIDRQYLWGSGILISPVLEENAVSVDCYFPKGCWYCYYAGTKITSTGEWRTISAPMDTIPLHVCGGNILPTQDPALNTTYSSLNDIGFIVALCENGKAYGTFYHDDGKDPDAIKNGDYFLSTLTVDSRTFTVTPTTDNCPKISSLKFGPIRIMGETNKVKKITVNGNSHDFIQNTNTKEININIKDLNMPANEAIQMQWTI